MAYQVRTIKQPHEKRDSILGEASLKKLKTNFKRYAGDPGYYICEVDDQGNELPETRQNI